LAWLGSVNVCEQIYIKLDSLIRLDMYKSCNFLEFFLTISLTSELDKEIIFTQLLDTDIVDVVADSPMFYRRSDLDETDDGDPTTSTWTVQVQVKRFKVA
jgi:hypothetical protein